MPQIDTIMFRCLNPNAQLQFYCDVLGMRLREDGAVAYGDDEARLRFEPSQHSYQPTPRDIYWKIAIAVPNIELAYEQLKRQGIAIDPPRQFQQIGYLTHFRDPEGFTVELIEHWFKGNRPSGDCDPSLFGGGPGLNLLTLRTDDITPVRKRCLAFGMKPLSVQPVTDHGFTLHFFAFTTDQPPNPDLIAIENREWLYQRPYTILEFQEVHGADVMIQTAQNAAGYAGTYLRGLDDHGKDDALTTKALINW